VATRNAETSDVCAAAETLRGYVIKHAGLANHMSVGLVARGIPSTLTTLLAAIPPLLDGQGGSSVLLMEDLYDAHKLCHGRDVEIQTVLQRRLFRNLEGLSTLSALSGSFSTASHMATLLEHACARLVPTVHGNLLARVLALDEKLRPSRMHLQNMHAAGMNVDQILQSVVTDHILTSSSSLSSAPSADSGSAGAVAGCSTSSGGHVIEDEMRRALDSNVFRETVSKCANLHGVELLETAFRSGSTLVVKYLVSPSASLARQHHFFGQLFQALPERQAYIARCLATNIKTGVVPETLSTFTWDMHQFTHLLKGDWWQLDFVNAPSGYYAMRDLEFSSTTRHLPSIKHYTVREVLTSTLDFAEALFTSIGLSTSLEDGEGYTYRDLVDKQIQYVDMAFSLADAERNHMLQWVDTQFRQALLRASEYFFTSLNSTTPALTWLSALLPPGALYFSAVDAHIKQLEPIALISGALGMGGALVGIPGTSTASPATALALSSSASNAARGASTSTDGNAARGGNGGRAARGSNGDRGNRSAPGSAVDIVKVLPNDQLYIAGSVYNLAAIAKKYKTTVNAHCYCWPVILSSKSGNAHLSLCSNHVAHGDMNSKMHKAPANFDLSHIRDYVQQATPEQRSAVKGASGGKRRKI